MWDLYVNSERTISYGYVWQDNTLFLWWATFHWSKPVGVGSFRCGGEMLQWRLDWCTQSWCGFPSFCLTASLTGEVHGAEETMKSMSQQLRVGNACQDPRPTVSFKNWLGADFCPVCTRGVRTVHVLIGSDMLRQNSVTRKQWYPSTHYSFLQKFCRNMLAVYK